MLSRHTNKFLRYFNYRVISNCSFASTNIEADPTERDPASFFFDKEVQKYLKRLTTLDYAKVFRDRKDGHKLRSPQYKFLTDEQLQEAKEAAKYKAKKFLQMPPMVKQRVDPSIPLSKDVALQDHDTAKYVFTDITYGLNNRERFIVVREPDGTLRYATWKERDRLIHIYFPSPHREINKPKMFEDKYLQDLLNREEYEFILNRACVQFEPDDPDYQTITREVYERINKEKHYDVLRSTRHFGPMVFHLIWTNNIDDLLCEMIESGRIDHAALLTLLYQKIHPTTKSAVEKCNDTDAVALIAHYACLDSPRKSIIEKLLQSYKESQQEQQVVTESIEQADVVSSETDVHTNQ